MFAASHVLALSFEPRGHYALSPGAWSLADVSPLERNLVGAARLFFDIVVAFGLPCVAWATAFRESMARLAGLTAAGRATAQGAVPGAGERSSEARSGAGRTVGRPVRRSTTTWRVVPSASTAPSGPSAR